VTTWTDVGRVLAYLEYTYGPQRFDVGRVLGYIEYTGDAAGSFTNDIPTAGEVKAYVEYVDAEARDEVGRIVGYIEYIDQSCDNVSVAGRILGYAEYIGDAAGAYTDDIPSTGQILGYVEYTYTIPTPTPPTVIVYGPLVWMT